MIHGTICRSVLVPMPGVEQTYNLMSGHINQYKYYLKQSIKGRMDLRALSYGFITYYM